jgi:tetratricopeptide (TPR) repeat protein
VNLDPQNAGYRLRLGESYEKLGSWDEAAGQYEIAAALDPPGAEALRRAERARALRDGKPPPPEPARPADSTPAAAAYEAGVALIGRGQYREALARLDEAVALDKSLAAAYSARASALFGLGRYVESAGDYRTALSLDPSQATPLFGLGECNRLLGQGAAAAEYYARFLQSTAPDASEDLRAEARRRLAELRR